MSNTPAIVRVPCPKLYHLPLGAPSADPITQLTSSATSDQSPFWKACFSSISSSRLAVADSSDLASLMVSLMPACSTPLTVRSALLHARNISAGTPDMENRMAVLPQKLYCQGCSIGDVVLGTPHGLLVLQPAAQCRQYTSISPASQSQNLWDDFGRNMSAVRSGSRVQFTNQVIGDYQFRHSQSFRAAPPLELPTLKSINQEIEREGVGSLRLQNSSRGSSPVAITSMVATRSPLPYRRAATSAMNTISKGITPELRPYFLARCVIHNIRTRFAHHRW